MAQELSDSSSVMVPNELGKQQHHKMLCRWAPCFRSFSGVWDPRPYVLDLPASTVEPETVKPCFMNPVLHSLLLTEGAH